jgi:hypothetical protein
MSSLWLLRASINCQLIHVQIEATHEIDSKHSKRETYSYGTQQFKSELFQSEHDNRKLIDDPTIIEIKQYASQRNVPNHDNNRHDK